MKRFGYTEYRLSKKADIKNATLDNTFKGENAWIQAKYLLRISRVFNVNMEYVITRQKTKFDENKKISELKDTILDLTSECNELKERNLKLEKALRVFVISDSATVKEVPSKGTIN